MHETHSIFTIGHSNRSLADFIALLQNHGVKRIADIRKLPRSRANPQFNMESLRDDLAANSIDYVHLPLLTGFRKGIKSEGSNGWRNPSFKAYAFYMLTADFDQGVDQLLNLAQGQATAMMCSEAVWWRCHRRLVADALIARGVEVRHILSQQPAKVHQLTAMAEVVKGVVRYREEVQRADEADHNEGDGLGKHPAL